MITGLRLRFTPAELRDHMAGRSAYHRERANDKDGELATLKGVADKLEATKEPENVQRMAKGYSNRASAAEAKDLVESLEQEIRDHRNKALAFDCFAAHLMSEDYDLGESDLVRLEILNR